MIWLQNYLYKIDPRFIDGAIAVGIAVLSTLALSFGQDDSAKWIDPKVRWYAIVAVSCFTQGLHALSKFRDFSGKPPDKTDPKPKET